MGMEYKKKKKNTFIS